MAVFQGARLRNGALPANDVAVRPRANAPASTRSGSHVGPVGLIIAAILASTMLGLVYLTQTLGSNATSSEIIELAGDANKLRGFLKTQEWTVELYMEPRDIAKRARKQDLVQLGEALVLPAP